MKVTKIVTFVLLASAFCGCQGKIKASYDLSAEWDNPQEEVVAEG